MQDDTLVVLAEYNTITEAEIAKSMLDSAGIWATIRNERDISAEFVAGLLHFINKIPNFRYPTKTERLCKTKPWLY